MKTLEERHKDRNTREKALIAVAMQGDEFFFSLSRTVRHWAHEGRMFVVWTVKNNVPHIRALLRSSDFTLTSQHGLKMVIDASMPDQSCEFRLGAKPQRIAQLDLYLWMQAHSDVRFVPINPDNLGSNRSLQITFMSQGAARVDDLQKEDVLYMDTALAFCKRWPQHAF